MAHRSGESRQQAALFPVMLDELVSPDAVVRVIDAWIGALPLTELGFAKSIPQRMGAPPYDPADLLLLYLWRYLNAVRSSRALERECHRNVECMWLLGRLAPDHKIIAEFRRGKPFDRIHTINEGLPREAFTFLGSPLVEKQLQ